jgi:glycosyltransferase involved in cell wall biosynthesis
MGNSGQPSRRPRLVCIVTHAVSARTLMRGQLSHFQQAGFDVTIIASPGPDLATVAQQEGIRVVAVPMEREIRPFRDLKSLWQLYRCLRRLKPDIVNAGTPKAGLLGIMASWLSRVPIRIYTLRGLRVETAQSWKLSAALAIAERIASACAHRIVCVSDSLRAVAIERRLSAAHKAVVLGGGSSNGVDAERFDVRQQPPSQIKALRTQLGVPDDAPVIGFAGRLTQDKGIVELFAAYRSLLKDLPKLRLLLVGDFESGGAVAAEIRQEIAVHPQVIVTGFVQDTAQYYGVMDLLAFPSYREGFPNVPLEAAAAGLPVVGYRATGTVDAVEDGVTGQLVACGDQVALAAAIRRYLGDARLRAQHGEAGRTRVQQDFTQQRVWAALQDEYVEQLMHRRLPAPTPLEMVPQTRAA